MANISTTLHNELNQRLWALFVGDAQSWAAVKYCMDKVIECDLKKSKCKDITTFLTSSYSVHETAKSDKYLTKILSRSVAMLADYGDRLIEKHSLGEMMFHDKLMELDSGMADRLRQVERIKFIMRYARELSSSYVEFETDFYSKIGVAE